MFRYYSEQASDAIRLFQQAKPAESGKLLDIGCGGGQVTATMAKGLPKWKVLGLDPHAPSIVAAQKDQPPPNVTFRTGTIDVIPVGSQYDLITIFSTLQLIPNAEEFLSRVRGLLKPKGQLIILVQPVDSPAAATFRDVLRRDTWKEYVSLEIVNAGFAASDYEKTLHTLGFTTVFKEIWKEELAATSERKLANGISEALHMFGNFPSDASHQCSAEIAHELGQIATVEFPSLAYIGRPQVRDI